MFFFFLDSRLWVKQGTQSFMSADVLVFKVENFFLKKKKPT